MSRLYTISSIITVAVGIYRPYDWPHIFGSPRDAYTVRKCWGRVWHQMLRKASQMLTSHGNFVASALGLPKCQFTTYFKLYVSFLVSGIIHGGGDYIFHQNWSTGRSIKFFLLQAMAITCEDAVIDMAKRLGYTTITPLSRFIGYFWVFVWFSFSVSFWLEPDLHAGAASSAGHTILPIMGLWKGEWTPAH
ncbi:hypothetical protein D9619_011004 [Psilocybe cf. subviscida]|uniref:Wax synthase domain-containing protein n=1 Tax=Psilocybe cf. subviscida TaxID=2480587 RepID=A0A8H5BA72_9AGAR|nr:hypothetical protein D9619_011004 [Psilocybe cf. subviscida]